MKALRLAELEELLHGQPFGAWWADFERVIGAAREARLHHEELLAQAQLMELRADMAQQSAGDVFTTGGDVEDAAARAGAEAQDLENRSLEIVASYEDQRARTSDTWLRLGGAERAVELAREAAAKDGRPEARAAVEAAERAHRELKAAYEAEDARRTRLWADVEGTWEKAFKRSLLAAETLARVRVVRREAERLFKEAEERRVRARQLRAEAEAAGKAREAAEKRRAELLALAAERFGCAPGEAFLYWRHRDDSRAGFAVALVDGGGAYNLEVKALGVYTVSRQRGVALLEPGHDGLGHAADATDRRIDETLHGPRPGGGEPSGPGKR